MTAASFAAWWEAHRVTAQSLQPALVAREAYLAGYADAMRQKGRRLEDQIAPHQPASIPVEDSHV